MTLSILRGLCRKACGGASVSLYVPDEYGVIRQALRAFADKIDGIPRRATITTANGTREYDTDDNFPSDFLSVQSVYNYSNNCQLRRIDYNQRLETSTGVPMEYYIRGLTIGFDKTCDDAYTIYFYYLGTGDDVEDDDDTVLAEFAFHDDDPAWKAFTHYFAREYWESKLTEAEHTGDANLILIAQNAVRRHEQAMYEARWDTMQRLGKWNMDQPIQVSLPPYFKQSSNFVEVDHGRVIRRR